MWGAEATGEELCLIDSGITDLNKVPLHPHLQVLNLHCNEIQKISGLLSVRCLRHLDLSSNRLRTLEGLDTLTQLRTLNLACNQLTTVQGLEALRSLVRLNLSYNQLCDVSGLQCLEGPGYRLSQLDLHGNALVSAHHVTRCLEGATNLRRLSLSAGGATNPCCQQHDYRACVLAALPQLQVLDGTDRHGNPADDLDILADIPGLEQYIDLLASTSGSEMNVASVITPKIDAAMATFKQRALVSSASTTPNVSVCDGGATGRDDSAGSQQGAAPQAADQSDRLEKLENMMLNLLKSNREVTTTSDSSTPQGQRSSPRSPQRSHPQRKAKRDIDDTDESEEDKRRTSKSKPHTTGRAPGAGKPAQRARSARRDKSPGARGKQRPTRDAACSLVVRGRSTSPASRQPAEVDATAGRARVTPQGPSGITEDAENRDDVRDTYVTLMRELETERERRWKAEQASRKLVEHIKEQQSKHKEEEELQGISLQATARLKEALMNEREAKLRLQTDLDQSQEALSDLRTKLSDAERSERQSREALRVSEDTAASAERERLKQQAHEAKRLQEATLKSAAAGREVDILRASVSELTGQVGQLQGLLADIQQGHRKELEGRHGLDSQEFQDAVKRQLEQTERLHGKQTDMLNSRIEQLSREYSDLEDEFRTALQIEGSRFSEVQKAYESLSRESADNKQSLGALRQKDAKTTAMMAELTALVKEQKGRITELSKAKQEQAHEYKERIQGLEVHLEEARRRMVAMELLKQEKTKLQASLQAQTSLVEGMRAEKRVWGDELVMQEASLAQDRGRMEAKIEALTSEVSTVKKHLEREADAVRIKAKMVDDQTETIRRLKEGVTERDQEIKKLRDETIRLQRDWEEQLANEAGATNELQEKLSRARERKDELKEQLAETEGRLDEATQAHSALSRKWKEKSSLIGQLERQVTGMKQTWEDKEARLAEERDRALDAASLAVDKLRSVDDAFRRQLDGKEESHQRALQELEDDKQGEVDAANKRVLEVEEEMRALLRETDQSKRVMDERVKKLTKAFSELQHDLF